jgi:putative ABC transport system permease protein
MPANPVLWIVLAVLALGTALLLRLLPIPLSYNLRNLFVRKASTAMTVLGVALVVGVFVSVMALAGGIDRAFRTSGSKDNLLLLRNGAQSETQSAVSRDQFALLRTLPGIAKGADGAPLVSAEAIVLINQPRRKDGKKANLIVRGLSPEGIAMRPEVKLAKGRWMAKGQSEIVTALRIGDRFASCALGEKVRFGGREWTVVGQFDAGGSAFESELWADTEDLIAAFNRRGFSSALIRPASANDAKTLAATIAADQRLNFKVQTEAAYYAEQAKTGEPIKGMAIFISGLMAVGAAFGAANTMYAAVAARTREVGTLRALGFSRASILVSFVLESIFLAAPGGLLGGLLAYALVDGASTGTANWVTFSEIAFAFRVTPELILLGTAFAAVIGALGGLLPAANAARKPVVTALREV